MIGYDGIRDAEYLEITTVQQPLFDSGALSVEMLLAALTEPDETPKETVLATELVVRGTTASPSQEKD